MSENILLISDPKILSVPISDNGETLVDLRKQENIMIDDRKSGDSDSYCFVRQSIADKLKKATKELQPNIRFLVIEGYRPISLQKEYFDWYSSELKKLHPKWLSDKIYEEASKYVAPPETIPPHSTGGAIDLTLALADGKELDMGTQLNADPEESQNACFTDAKNISEKAKRNRDILITAMAKGGFINYPTEWWHWSYGDRYWAYCTKASVALYGSI